MIEIFSVVWHTFGDGAKRKEKKRRNVYFDLSNNRKALMVGVP
jgi:hypothetical protein